MMTELWILLVLFTTNSGMCVFRGLLELLRQYPQFSLSVLVINLFEYVFQNVYVQFLCFRTRSHKFPDTVAVLVVLTFVFVARDACLCELLHQVYAAFSIFIYPSV